MADFGGTASFTFNGQPLVMRGHITTEPSNVKAGGLINQDGSTSRTLTPKGFVAVCKFEDSTAGLATPQPWDSILKGGPYNITVVEQQTGVLHMWSSAKFTGDIKVDREKGEVDGLSILADTYVVKAA